MAVKDAGISTKPGFTRMNAYSHTTTQLLGIEKIVLSVIEIMRPRFMVVIMASVFVVALSLPVLIYRSANATSSGGLLGTLPSAGTYEENVIYLPLVMRNFTFIPTAPVLFAINNPGGSGDYTVSWSSVKGADSYILQEDDNGDFSSPIQRYDGSNLFWNVSGKLPGTYYYRVKARNAWNDSDWSNVRQVTVTPPTSDVSVENNTGGNLCYEVYDTGIGKKCFPSGTHFYGSFPSGTYTWHASAPCGSDSDTEYYWPGEFIHEFRCVVP